MPAQLTNNQQLMLYSLGLCCRQLNKRFEDKPLEASVSKILFIETLLKSALVSKKTRALYRNLELLEGKKLITYRNRQIHFTKRGYSLFNKLDRQVEPYIRHRSFWSSPIIFDRNIQARLRQIE